MFVRNRYRDIKQKYLSIYFNGLAISASDPHTDLLIVIKSSEQWHI